MPYSVRRLQADGGTIEMDGLSVRFGSVSEGIEAGVSFVHQELSVVGALSVAENLHLGRMPRTCMGLVDIGLDAARVRALLQRVAPGHIQPDREAGTLRRVNSSWSNRQGGGKKATAADPR